jgi:hypothetical protein
MVDFPAPVGPTSANVSPSAIERSTCSSTSASGEYPKVTSWSVILPSMGGSSVASGFSRTDGNVAKSSRSLVVAALPCWYVLYSWASCWMGANSRTR